MGSKFTYLIISWGEFYYSRTGVKNRGLRDLGINVEEIAIPKGLRRGVNSLRRLAKEFDLSTNILVVASPCHSLVILCRLAGISKVFLDAGWPLSDSTRIRSKRSSVWTQVYSFCKSYLIDFLSFHLSSLVFLESEAQALRVKRHFLIRKHRVKVSYTSFDESRAHTEPQENSIKVELECNNKGFNFMLFRGKRNEEGGLDVIIKAMEMIKVPVQLVILTDSHKLDPIPENIRVVTEYVSDQELQYYYTRSLLTFGQFGHEKRQDFSLPHKLFESAYFAKPYITPRTKAIQEIYQNKDEVIFADLTTPEALAKQIDQILLDGDKLVEVGLKSKARYEEKFSQEKVSLKFLIEVESSFRRLPYK